jgi:membrane protein required for colicin V production
MNWVDFSIIAFVLLSGVISYFYGFVKELFSFLSWLLSFIIALLFLGGLDGLLTTLIPTLTPYDDLRLGAALIALFFLCFLLLELISHLILNSIGPTHLSGPDRVLGVVFGVARGSVIVTWLIMLAGLTHLPAGAAWQESVLIRQFLPIVKELRSQLPSDVATKFDFDAPPELQPPSF